MIYSLTQLLEIGRKEAQFIQEQTGFTTGVVGGLLRCIKLGGTTNDIDIAIILPNPDLLRAIHLLLRLRGYVGRPIRNTETTYRGSTYYVGDWRKDIDDGYNINIIAYVPPYMMSIRELVRNFDLNINTWFLDSDGMIYNDLFSMRAKYVAVTPHRRIDTSVNRRIQRFKQMYPQLDWSGLDSSTWAMYPV